MLDQLIYIQVIDNKEPKVMEIMLTWVNIVLCFMVHSIFFTAKLHLAANGDDDDIDSFVTEVHVFDWKPNEVQLKEYIGNPEQVQDCIKLYLLPRNYMSSLGSNVFILHLNFFVGSSNDGLTCAIATMFV